MNHEAGARYKRSQDRLTGKTHDATETVQERKKDAPQRLWGHTKGKGKIKPTLSLKKGLDVLRGPSPLGKCHEVKKNHHHLWGKDILAKGCPWYGRQSGGGGKDARRSALYGIKKGAIRH